MFMEDLYDVFTLYQRLRIQWRFSRILKASNKSAWSNVFWYFKVYIFCKFIQYTIHWDKTQMLKKISLDKINATKNVLFFFRDLQLIKVLLLIGDSHTSWSTRFISLKVCVGFYIFDFDKESLTLNRHNYFQKKNTEKSYTVLLPDLWFLSCNKKFENSVKSAWVGAPQKVTWRRTFQT